MIELEVTDITVTTETVETEGVTAMELAEEDGAATSVYLAASPAVEGVSGRYFVDCREARSSPPSYDERLARRLWDASARMTGLVE